MDTAHYIDITGCNLVELVKKAYELSSPRGMGFLHAKPGGLTDDEARQLIKEDHPWNAVDMDYVLGRCVKFTVRKEDGRLFTQRRWYDHTEQDLIDLLAHVGIAFQVDQSESPA